MSKRKPIDVGALQAVAGNPVAPIAKIEATATGRPPSRADKVQIGAFVDPALRMRLKVLSAEQGKPIGALIEEALNDLLLRNGK